MSRETRRLQPVDQTSVALVLTATVDPTETPLVLRTDPNSRYSDYRIALEKWQRLGDQFTEIVVIENSAHALVNQLEKEFPQVRIVSYREAPTSRHRGKGYGEALMLERLNQSITLMPAMYILKCTGRLYCRNVIRLLSALDGVPDLVIRISRDLSYADSRLFAVRTSVLGDFMAGVSDTVDDKAGTFIEHALARAALRMAGDGYRVMSWPSPPFFVGTSASTGAQYDSITRYALRPVQVLIHQLSKLNRYR